MFQRFEGIL